MRLLLRPAVLCIAALFIMIGLVPSVAQAAWSEPVRVSDDLVDSSAAIGVADDGTTTVIWTTTSGPDPGQVIRLARISPSGTVGPSVDIVRADSRFTIINPALGVGPDGTAVVAWSDHLNNPSRVSAVRISADNQLGPLQVLASVPYNGIPPSYGKKVVVDSVGTATVVWHRDTADGSNSVVEAVRMPAGSPAEPARILASNYGHLGPSIAAQRDGRVLVAWSPMFDGPPRFTTISAAGTQGAVQDLSGEPGSQTNIATASNGQATVTWMRGSDNSLHARQIDSSGALGPDVQLSATGEQVAQYRLALTTSGVTTALWTDRTDLRIAHLQADGSAVPPRTISTAPIGYSSIELALSVDNANNAQGTWIGSDNRIRARRIPFGEPPEAMRVLSPPSDSLSRSPVSVTTPSGVGTTMWLDPSSGTQQLYVAPADSGVVDGPPIGPVPPPPPPPPPPVSCPAVKLIGVAGSGENGGPGTNVGGNSKDKPFAAQLGSTVATFRDALAQRVGKISAAPGVTPMLADQAIDYPAVPVGSENAIRIANSLDAINDTGNYRASVDKGVTELVRVLAEQATDRCASISKYVIAGYSQGAQVIGDMIDRDLIPTKLSRNIKSIVFFGDPKFNFKAHRVIARSSFDRTVGGVLGARRDIAFDNLSGQTSLHSYCRELDNVCQASLDGRPHQQYKKAESYWAAWNTEDMLFPGTVIETWQPTATAKFLGNERIRLTCKVVAKGVCHIRAKISYTNLLGIQGTETVRYVGRADDRGKVTADISLRFIVVSFVKSAEATVTATGIGAGYSEQTSARTIRLR